MVRPHGAAAFDSTQRRLTQRSTVCGIGDKAIYDVTIGLIVWYGDTAVSTFVPAGIGTREQRLSMEKELATAVEGKL